MTNESLRKRITSDINYIKRESENLEKTLVSHNISPEISKQIQSVLDYFAITDFSFITDIINQEILLGFKNRFSPYKIAMEAFIQYPESTRLKNFIEVNNKMYEYIEHINNGSKKAVLPSIDPENLYDELQKIYKRIDLLENKPDEIIKVLNENLKQSEKLTSNANELSQKSEQTLEDILKFKQETIEQNNKLVTKLENTINQKISVILSDQLEKKSFRLFLETIAKFLFFIFTVIILFLFNKSFLELYLNISTLPIAPQIYPALSKMEFWHFIVLKLSMNIPLFIIVAFAMNGYSKSKKLYEEYEFRKISAITLFNNYERLTKEIGMEKEDLMESLKLSLEKIFDNPVHSIYGDKSGDKNIGLDQLEKITSIIEKMRK